VRQQPLHQVILRIRSASGPYAYIKKRRRIIFDPAAPLSVRLFSFLYIRRTITQMSQPGISFSSFYPSGTADLLYLIVKVQNLLYADPFRALKLCAAC
jgi:hypothetical protein